MSKKQIIGVAIDGSHVKLARLSITRKSLKIEGFQRIELSEEIEALPFQEAIHEKINAPVQELVHEEVASELEQPHGNGFDQIFSEEQDSDEVFDLEDDVDGEEINETLQVQLAELFKQSKQKKVRIALSLPLGSTIVHPMGDTDYSDLKPKTLQDEVRQKIETVYEPIQSDVEYAYEIQTDGSLLLVSREGPPPSLQAIDEAGDLAKRKVIIEEILPDEAAVVGLVRQNYDLSAETITGIVIAGHETSRILFLQGHEILAILPLLHAGHRADSFIQTIYSKILLELDQGKVPYINKLVFSNISIDAEDWTYLSSQFPETDIETIRLSPEQIEFDEELQPLIPEFAQAIAAAWACIPAADEVFPSLSLMPEYVQERQKIFRIAWHGVVVLLFIALTPVIFNQIYQEHIAQYQKQYRKTLQIWNQVELHKPVAAQTESYANNMAIQEDIYSGLRPLTNGTLKWTETLRILSDGIRDVSGCWVTNLVTIGNDLVIEGLSKDRDRVPILAGLFHEVEIKEIIEVQQRGIPLYKYILIVHRVSDNEDLFNQS